MRLVSFERAGKSGFGAVVGDGVVDLGIALGGRYADIKALLEGDGLEAAKAAVAGRAADDALADLVLAPVIPNPGKIWCCGLNYAEHVRETQREVTEKPMFFMRVADSQVGHGQAIPRPPESTQLDFEGEIAVIIGRRGRRIAEAPSATHHERLVTALERRDARAARRALDDDLASAAEVILAGDGLAADA